MEPVTDMSERRERLRRATLYVLVDGGESPGPFERLVSRLLEVPGVDVLQLRDKRLGDRELLDRARRLRALTRDRATLFVMNDRVDLALLAEADGVHVGQDELTVADVRRLAGPRLLIGRSTHDLQQLAEAHAAGADYVACGPTFPSGTKQFERLAGLDYLRKAAAELRVPGFAIGGIDLDNVSEVRRAGFRRIAVSGVVARAADPARAVAALKEVLECPDGSR